MSIWGKLAGAGKSRLGGPVGSLRSGVGYQAQNGSAENQVAFIPSEPLSGRSRTVSCWRLSMGSSDVT